MFMTNEELTREIMEIKEKQIRMDSKHERYDELFKTLQDDIKTTRDLAEDVHVIATNMRHLQSTQDSMKQQLDKIVTKDYDTYKERKKLVVNQIITGITGSILTLAIGVIGWLIITYILSKGG